MKKKKNVMYRKSVSLLAAAAMTAVLMTGQVYPVAAWGQSTETLSLIHILHLVVDELDKNRIELVHIWLPEHKENPEAADA